MKLAGKFYFSTYVLSESVNCSDLFWPYVLSTSYRCCFCILNDWLRMKLQKNIFFATERRNVNLVFNEIYSVTIASFKIMSLNKSMHDLSHMWDIWLKRWSPLLPSEITVTAVIGNYCAFMSFLLEMTQKNIIIGMLMLPLFRPPAVCISWVCKLVSETSRVRKNWFWTAKHH